MITNMAGGVIGDSAYLPTVCHLSLRTTLRDTILHVMRARAPAQTFDAAVEEPKGEAAGLLVSRPWSGVRSAACSERSSSSVSSSVNSVNSAMVEFFENYMKNFNWKT